MCISNLKDVLQAHPGGLYLAGVFQSAHFKFLDMFDHLKNSSGALEDTETTIHPASTSQEHFKRSILCGLSDIYSSMFGGGISMIIAKPS